ISDLSWSSILVFRNSGTGDFLPPVEYDLENVENLRQITAADLNNDGYDDIITTARWDDYPIEDHYVVVMYNQRDGTFGYLPDDTIPPQVSFVNMKSGMKVSEDVLIEIDAYDVSGIDKVEIHFNDSEWFSCTQNGLYWEYLWDSSGYQDAGHVKIQARAFDKALNENVGYTDEIEVEVFKWTSTDIYVDAVNGDDYNSGISKDAALRSITVAIPRAKGSEENPVIVHLAPGIYYEESGEKFPIEMKSYITLLGDDRDAVIIASATYDVPVINCMNIQDSCIENVTITVGDISYYEPGKFQSRGVNIENSSFTIKGCIIKDFSVDYYNYAVNAENSDVKILECKITEIKSSEYSWNNGSALIFQNSSVNIEDTEIRNNETEEGVVYCNESTIQVLGCDITENVAGYPAAVDISHTEVDFFNCNFTDNDCTVLDVSWNSRGTIENCSFLRNGDTAIEGGYSENLSIRNCLISETRGNGISISANSVSIIDCHILKSEDSGITVSSNSALIKGCIIESNNNGIAAFGNVTIEDCVIKDNESTRVGGIWFYNADAVVNRCEIKNNKVTGHYYDGAYYAGVGGGVYVYGSGQVGIYNSEIIGNTAEYGGGVHFVFNKKSSEIVNCLLLDNSAERYGGAVHSTESQINIINSTIVNNSAEINEGGVSINSFEATIKNSILWNNPGGSIGGNVKATVTYSCVEGGYNDVGNFKSNPLFVSGPWGDYYLSNVEAGQPMTSPCVNGGDESAPITGFDRMWTTTRTDGVFDMDRLDMGYHYPPAVSFGLSITPEKESYVAGDTFYLLEDVKTANLPFPAELFFTMQSPDG
ncbi:right-handed parallel beta-helix repeat-containing protein, partial [bacterium]|nr:right-handed parallel beta-helix repeat-containing protein [bacterium]